MKNSNTKRACLPRRPDAWLALLRDAWKRLSDEERVRFLAEQEGWISDLLERDERAVALIDALRSEQDGRTSCAPL